MKLFIVLTIQRANKSRVNSMKSRSMFFAYYWDNMKVDVSKVLLDQPPEILEKSKIIAGKIFSIPESLKINFIKKYVEY
jgi:hypothetical protein